MFTNVKMTPAHIRRDRLVPVSGAAQETYTPKELEASPALPDPRYIFRAKAGDFVGIAKRRNDGREVSFHFGRLDQRGSISFLLKTDPSFPERVVKVWRVDVLRRAGQMRELETAKDTSPSQAAAIA